MQKKYRRFLMLLTLIMVASTTVAYSALTASLNLTAEARLRTVADIRVTGISLSSSNGGTLQYESRYDVNSITSGFKLPTTESSITYKVQVTNNGTVDQTIYDILNTSSNNSGLYYTISGYNLRDVIGFKTVVEFYITYKTTTPSNEVINVINNFNFKRVYHITFEAKGGTSIPEGIKYEGVDLSLSTFIPTKQGYILSGWTDEQNGTTVKYNTNGTYTLDRDLILYAVWASDPNTNYSVNHYVHDLGTNTYTLNSTDNLTGETDSTVTLENLKKTIPGFTYVDGYLSGGTTKPTSGAVTTTTVLADGSRVINLYYRRNYLYVQYHVNGGQLAEQHGSYFGITNSLVTSTGNTTPNKFWVGVYGSKVNAVTNANTYTQGTAGLDNYNNPNYLNLEKTGYTGKSGQEWNTNASGTGTSYSQATTTYDANTFGGADLSTGDQVVTLYVNWVPVDYEIMYDLQGGTLSTTNPATYNIETNTFTLNNPTQPGYTFTGWTGSNGNTPQTTVTIAKGSSGDRAYIAHWQANSYTVTADANGGSIPSTNGWTGTGNTATKSVTYDSTYGTLPTPTRSNYVFKGWNGKNYYNYQDFKQGNGYTIDNNGWITFNTSAGKQYYTYYTHNLDVQKNTTYLVVTEIGSINNVRGYFYVTSKGASTHQFRSTVISPNDIQANRIYVNQVKTMNTENAGFDDTGIRTFYDNPIEESNNRYKDTILSFRVSILDADDTITPSNFRYEPYYVTSSTNVTQAKDHTLKAIWEKKEATFLRGSEFNAKIKQLAGNENATYQTSDTNITSIVRSNSLDIMPVDENVVSTSDSNTPIYAWFDNNNGTLYYYTDAVNLYMNVNANYMFYKLRNVNSIDLDDINTTKTTSMYALFHSCLNLSNLDLSDFNTENVQQTQGMFYNCSSLTSIDLSSFDMSKVTNTSNMLDSMTLLKSLKTPDTYPTDSSVKITLPKNINRCKW